MKRIIPTLMAICIACCAPVTYATAIVQFHVPVKQVSVTDALEIFTGARKKWSNGSRITIILQDVEALDNRLFSSKLGIPHNQFVSMVNKNINDGAAVKFVDSSNQVIISVSNTINSAGVYGNTYIENFNGVRRLEIK